MVDLAKFGSQKPCSLSHVSVRQNISLSYLEQIFNDLKKAELVKSQKGPGGGYVLNKQTEEIKNQQKQSNVTKRVTVPDLEKILYEAIPILDHGFITQP